MVFVFSVPLLYHIADIMSIVILYKFCTSFCSKTTPPLIGRFLTVEEFFRFNEDLYSKSKKVAKTAYFTPFPRRIERRFGVTLCLIKKSAHILRMQADNH